MSETAPAGCGVSVDLENDVQRVCVVSLKMFLTFGDDVLECLSPARHVESSFVVLRAEFRMLQSVGKDVER